MANPFQGDDQDDFSGVRDQEGNVKRAGLARSAKLSNFGAAFNAARKAGDKTFMFKGKKYTTDMASPKAKSNTDIITEGATKLYNESGGFKPGFLTADQIAKADELTRGMSDTARSQMGEFGTMKKGGVVKKMKKGGTVSSASKRADGIATKGKTKGRFV